MDRHLLTFVTVSKEKNFTRAAEQLHLSQSAVSREIETLEKEYGAKLFDRTNKYVRLTKAGEILYHHAENILIQQDRAKRLIYDLTHMASGGLSIGSGYTFGEYILPWIISDFRHTYPLVTPKITIMNSKRISTQVHCRELDLGIVEGDLKPEDLVVKPFAQDEMMVIVPSTHRLSNKSEVDFASLESETWILRETGSGTREVTERVFSKVGFCPLSIMEFGSSQIIKESVEAGLGISLISKWVIRKEIDYGLLHALRIKEHPIVRNFSYVIHASQFRTKAMELFLDFLDHFPY